MAPGPFETHVYSLQSAFSVSLSQGQWSGADLQENSLGHSSGCFESSESATHNLCRRHRASTVPWNQRLTFDYLSGAGQHQAERSVAQMGTLTLDSCSETTFMSVDTCDVTTMVPGSTGSDSYQYIGDTHPSYVECRYHVPLLLVLNSILILHLWLVLPVYPVYYTVKKQPSQDVLHGDAAEEELGLACLVSSYTLPHQNSQPGRRGRQTARSKMLSRRARDT